LGIGVWGLGFGVWGVGFGVWGLGFGVGDLGFHLHVVRAVWSEKLGHANKRSPLDCCCTYSYMVDGRVRFVMREFLLGSFGLAARGWRRHWGVGRRVKGLVVDAIYCERLIMEKTRGGSQ